MAASAVFGRNRAFSTRGECKVFGLGATELIVILVIVVIVFGVGKLPELGSGLGEGIKNFKKSYRDAKEIDVTPEGAESAPEKKAESAGE